MSQISQAWHQPGGKRRVLLAALVLIVALSVGFAFNIWLPSLASDSRMKVMLALETRFRRGERMTFEDVRKKLIGVGYSEDAAKMDKQALLECHCDSRWFYRLRQNRWNLFAKDRQWVAIIDVKAGKIINFDSLSPAD